MIMASFCSDISFWVDLNRILLGKYDFISKMITQHYVAYGKFVEHKHPHHKCYFPFYMTSHKTVLD